MKKKIFALFLTAALLISMLPIIAVSINAAAPTSDTTGMTFDDTGKNVWKTNKLLTTAPHTFETWVKVAKDEVGAGSGRVGGIFNNYLGDTKYSICFDIYNGGQPRLFYGYTDANGVEQQVNSYFTKVDIRTGEWLHLAVVLDEVNLKLHCYINGELKQTLTVKSGYDTEKDLNRIFSLGMDNRETSYKYHFYGSIANFSCYGDTLSAADIANIYANGPMLDNESIVCAYDTSTQPTGNKIEDLTDNNYNLYITDPKVCTPYEVEGEEDDNTGNTDSEVDNAVKKDCAYSFAVVGDTQYLVRNDVNNGTNNTATLYDWILANKDAKKIHSVFGLGDITDSRTVAAEWQHAKDNITKLEGKLPYYVVRGNHDNSDMFNEYFNNDSYKSQFVDPDIADQTKVFFSKKLINNGYTKFTVGGTKYLLMMLDYGAKEDAIAWANDVIASNPTYKVIINTHAYLGADGTWLDDETYSPDPESNTIFSNGKEMWENLVSKHENIFLVLCGHDNKVPNSDIIKLQSKGEKGNTVTQLMINPQTIEENAASQQYGMVAMLYFNEDGSEVEVEYISTVLSTEGNDYLYRDVNQFEFTVNPESENDDDTNTTAPTIEISADGYWVINGVKTEYKAIGSNGKDGVDGEDGKDGVTPSIEISADGYWVINGVKTEYKAIGSDGKDGVDGEDGEDGKDGVTPTIEISADGYWVINGVKTEHKAIGSDGKDGADGEDGKDGADGKDGVTPTIEISEDGYWVINGVKTEYKAIGTDGKDGKDGKDGTDGKDGKDGTNGKDGVNGKDGITPTIEIDKDGYWVINGVKTEYKATATIDADSSNVEKDDDSNILPIACTAICLASCLGTIIFCVVTNKKKAR